MFNTSSRIGGYFDSRGQKINLMDKFNSKVENIFGNNGSHSHLNMDKGMEQFLERHKAPYKNTKMVRDLKLYIDRSLDYDWIRPIICR